MDNLFCTIEKLRLGPAKTPRLQVDELQLPLGVTAVLGKSGAGKSSLLNILVRFEKPDQGQVQFLKPSHPERMPISWVPADFGLWSHLNVKEHLLAASGGDDEFASELLQQFDLEACQRQLPATLSMGERARLAVARSLATRAVMHVMDEPFAHVDPARIDRYWNHLREHLNATNASLIFASHSPNIVLREAQHLICLEEGKVVWTGSPNDLYQTPPNHELGALLGPLNWFEESEIQNGSSSNSEFLSARPEQLVLEELREESISTQAKPSWQVEESWNLGSHQETLVSDEPRGLKKTVYHRPVQTPLSSGAKVTLRIVTSCLLLFFMLFNSGCRESAGNEPKISVTDVDQFLLPAEGAMLPAARGMTYHPAGDLLILDNVGRVLRYDSAGELVKKWWMPDYDVGRPEGICVLKDGRMAVADTHYNRVVIFDKDCNVSSMFGETGHGPGQFIYSSAVAQDDEGFIYVAEYGGNDRIQKFTADGDYVLEFGGVGAEDGEFQRPSGLVWYDGVLYVADAINNRIQAFSSGGKFLRIVADAHSTGLYYPYDISLGPDQTLFVIEYGAGRITRVSLDGELIGRYGTEGRGNDQFWTPWGIAVNPSGKIAVADTGNRRVVELQLDE
jgi:iron(III) transport system ATP-binding protein